MMVGNPFERLDGARRVYRAVADLIREEPSAQALRSLPSVVPGSSGSHDRHWTRLFDALSSASLDELWSAYRSLRRSRALGCPSPWAPSRRALCESLGLPLGAGRVCDLDFLAESVDRAQALYPHDRQAAHDVLARRKTFLLEHAVSCIRPLIVELRQSSSNVYSAAGDALAVAGVIDYRHAAPSSGLHRAPGLVAARSA